MSVTSFPSPLLGLHSPSLTLSQARITDLERLKVKTEAANTDPIVKFEGSSLKRERKDDGGNEGSRQRRRTSFKVEHVDLTDD